MTDGLFKKLSPEQQAAALAFDGNPDFGPPMTDLTQAIALMRRVCAAEGPWEAEDFVRSDDLAKGLQPGPVDKAEATILNAAASGELFPLADHKLAVAEAYRQIAEIARIRAEQHTDMALNGLPENARTREAMEAAFTEMRWAILALIPDDALAEVQALRAANEQFQVMAAEEQRARKAAEAELAATQAKLARAVGAQKVVATRGAAWHCDRKGE